MGYTLIILSFAPKTSWLDSNLLLSLESYSVLGAHLLSCMEGGICVALPSLIAEGTIAPVNICVQFLGTIGAVPYANHTTLGNTMSLTCGFIT